MPTSNTFELLDMIEKASYMVTSNSSHVSIDEMLRKFMGVYKNKHRITSKPAKEGIKIFICCDSETKLPIN